MTRFCASSLDLDPGSDHCHDTYLGQGTLTWCPLGSTLLLGCTPEFGVYTLQGAAQGFGSSLLLLQGAAWGAAQGLGSSLLQPAGCTPGWGLVVYTPAGVHTPGFTCAPRVYMCTSTLLLGCTPGVRFLVGWCAWVCHAPHSGLYAVRMLGVEGRGLILCGCRL